MHEHPNEETILDLRSDPDITDAEISARLDGCAQCLADLDEQQTIASYLADLDSPSLTGTERAALRTAVLEEIQTAKVIPLSRGQSWDWTRLGTVAAALVGVVAVAGLFSVIGGGMDEAGTGDDSIVTTEAADASDGVLSLEAAPSADVERAEDADEAAADFGGASLAAPSDLVVALGEVDRDTFEAELDGIRRQVVEMTESSGVLQRAADEVDLSCLDRVPDTGAVRAIVTATVDGLDVEAYFAVAAEEFGYASMDCSAYELP